MTNSYHLSADELEMRVQERTAELEKANQALRVETRDTRILHKLSTQHIEGGDLSSILLGIVDAAIEITGADKGNIQVLDPSEGKLRIAAQRGFGLPFLEILKSVDVEEATPYRTAVERMESVVVEDITQSALFIGSSSLSVLLNEGIRAVLSTPLFSRSGEPLGIISVYFFHIHTPGEHELVFLDILARQAADIIDHKQAEEELRGIREDLNRTQAMGNIGSWRLNPQKNEMVWSDENYRIFGIPTGTPLTQELFLSTVHPDDREFVDKRWKAGLAGEPLSDIEHRIIVDGKTKWVHQIAHLEFDKNGTLLDGFGITQDITERKRAEEELRETEQRTSLKLETIVSPDCELTNMELAEIVDVKVIQSLMNDFSKVTHIPIGLNDLKGNVLAGAGWQDICTKFHRIHPEACKHCIESDTRLSTCVVPGEYKLYKCKNNMWDISTPIMVGGQQVGFLFTGQFFFDDEPVDYELFRSQARKYGFNEEEYIAALEKVPRLDRETVETSTTFLMKLANMISQLSYSNIRLVHSLAERDSLVDALRESEKRERARSDELTAVLDSMPAAVWIAHDPKALQITGNRLSCEWLHTPRNTNFSKSAPEGEKPEMFTLFKDGVEIPPADMPLQMSAAGRELNDYEIDIMSSDGTIRHVLGNARALRGERGNLRGSVAAFIDITDRKRADLEREMTVAFLRLVNESKGTADLVHSAVSFFRERSGLEAVGIRLKEGGDYPYCETSGFPGEFVKMENSLCARDEFGQLLCDNAGNPVLECMCGNVICGRFDISKPFFTSRGSFWTNSTTELLTATTDADRKARTRNRCNGEGYESVALIALRVGEQRLGLLQLNDRLKGQFSPEAIAMWERLADYLAVALARARAEEKLRAAYGNLQVQSEELQAKSDELLEINEALRESEDRFRSVLENSLDAAYRRNLQTDRYDYLSPVIEQITGFSVQEMGTMSFNEFFKQVHPDDIPLIDSKITQTLDTGIGIFEYRFKCKDGQYRWFADQVKVINDQNGSPLFIGGVVRDITERKQAEEALRLSSIYNRSLIEASLDPLVTIGLDGKIMDVNGATEQITGYSSRELIGTDFSDYFTEPESARKGYQQVFTYGKVWDYPLEIQHKDGHTTPVLYNASVYRDENGEVIGVFAAARDVTERKKAEEALRKVHDNLEKLVEERTEQLEKAYKSLKESEKGLADAQRMAHIGNWRWNIATNELFWSDEVYRIFGLNPQETRVTYDSFINYVHPDDRDYLINAVKEGLNGSPFDVEYRIVLADGEERIVYTEAEAINYEENIPVQAKGIIQDITERKRAEEELEKVNRIRIKEIHHRIKNNLQVISSLLDLQAEKFQSKECIEDSEVLEAFGESQNRVLSMSLIHEELYKGEGTDKLNFSAYVQRLAENLFQAYSVNSKNIRLLMDLEEKSFFDMDTAIPLGIIVNELVSNSLKHAFNENQEGEIRIRLCREEENSKTHEPLFSLTISDNGKGLPENKELDSFESLGLQLVIALVDQLDGEIDTKREHGTVFKITFNAVERL